MHLNGLDLNLLVALDALLTETNVTRAAQKIHISQPGMSASLQKLREHFADPLLEKVGRQFILTPRAKTLVEPVRMILSDIDRLTNSADNFDPAALERTFKLSASTFCIDMLSVPLLEFFSKVAPGVSCQFDDLLSDSISLLAEGKSDLAISIAQRPQMEVLNFDAPLASETFFSDHMVLVVAENNKKVGTKITLDELCELPFIGTRFGRNIVSLGEQVWNSQPKRPRVKAWLPNFQMTLDTVGQTDCIAMVPSKIIQLHIGRYRVRTLPVPFEVPLLDEKLFWHPRNEFDPAHKWFREALQSILKKLDNELLHEPAHLAS